jgi:hypothetical protein
MTYHLIFCPGNNKDCLQLQVLCTYEDKRAAIDDMRHTFQIRGHMEKSDHVNGKVVKVPHYDFANIFKCMISSIDRDNRLYLIKITEPSISRVKNILDQIRESIV